MRSLVAKLPTERVDELVSGVKGDRSSREARHDQRRSVVACSRPSPWNLHEALSGSCRGVTTIQDRACLPEPAALLSNGWALARILGPGCEIVLPLLLKLEAG
jgi:hypothetical protein